MDKETLTNHIARLSKHYFDSACKIVLRDIFYLNAINVDGKNDGGTDFSSFGDFGETTSVAYQITTQKSDINNKAYKDAKKSIKKLNVKRYYFFTTLNIDETQRRKIENEISKDLGIQGICLDSSSIAGLILENNKLTKFLNDTNSPLPREYKTSSFDYREVALHSYTLLSNDSKQLKENIFDDTILFILSKDSPLSKEKIKESVKTILDLNEEDKDIIDKRIGALFGKEKLSKNEDGLIYLKDKTEEDITNRKEIYKRELVDLSSAQIHLLKDYDIEWNLDDSRKISVWIANAFISEQFSNLREIKASIVSHPIFSNLNKDGISKIKTYIKKKKKLDNNTIDKIVEEIIKLASNHPLITKITRASMYLALQGSNPIASAKALGANRWSDFNIIIEPTIAIPYICSDLFKGAVNKYFDFSVRAIKRAKKLDSKLYIPYPYIQECAGHLLHARKYNDLNLDEEELKFSSNAFVANYYALKSAGVKVPDKFIDYLSYYSANIKTEKNDIKKWIRGIMTDLQTILNRNGIEFISIPTYNEETCKDFKEEYSYHLMDLKMDKPNHLINHDIWILQFTNDLISKENEHWIILTYDRSLISFGKTDTYKGWITNPYKFIDISETSKKLSEMQFVSLLHTVATYSETTLSIGARIMDKIIMYASKEMQNWEFKQEIELFKKELIKSVSDIPNYEIEVDRKTDEFLKKKGINLKINEEEEIDE